MTQANEIVIVARKILVSQVVNVYHETLFIQLKFSLATINKETNILVSARQNSKADQVRIKIHLKTDKKKKALNFLNIHGDKNIKNYSIKWSVVKQTSGYNSVTNSYNVCLSEKLITCSFIDKNRLINKRMDLVSKCGHESKFILSNYKP